VVDGHREHDHVVYFFSSRISLGHVFYPRATHRVVALNMAPVMDVRRGVVVHAYIDWLLFEPAGIEYHSSPEPPRSRSQNKQSVL
jgi:hypothetical protein